MLQKRLYVTESNTVSIKEKVDGHLTVKKQWQVTGLKWAANGATLLRQVSSSWHSYMAKIAQKQNLSGPLSEVNRWKALS